MEREKAAGEIKRLRNEIDRHNYLYYVEARPVISDFEFDKLLERLVELESRFPDLITPDSPSLRVGGEVTKEFSSVRHREPMLSLANTYSQGEVVDFYKRLGKLLKDEGVEEREMVAELKFDGVAVSLIYRDGLLVRGATRGDGIRGDDITVNLRTIGTIPLRLDSGLIAGLQGEAREIEVRGEVFIRKDDFERLNEGRLEEDRFANSRNATAGTLKLQDSAEVAHRSLTFVAYFLKGIADENTSHLDRLLMLEKLGFYTGGHYRICPDLEAVERFIGEWSEKRWKLPYETDGVVLKLNAVRLWERIGSTSKSPRWAIAYKYPAQQAETELLGVVFQVGRLGTITPVAELQPVRLAGSTVSRSTLHNFDEIDRLGVQLHDRVVIEKSGEVIPKIIRVLPEHRTLFSERIQVPSICPSCGTPLVKPAGEVSWYCPNEEGCPAQIKGRILHFASRNAMDIRSLGSALVDQLVGSGLVRDPGDLYSLDLQQIAQLDRMGEKSAQNLLGALDESRKRSYERMLYALGIRHVGQATARELARAYPLFDDLQQADEASLALVPDIGPVVAQSIVEYFSRQYWRETIRKLIDAGLSFRAAEPEKPVNRNFEGITVMFTGELERYGRNQASELVLKRGGKVAGSASRKTTLVVAGKGAGTKLEKARKLGIKEIGEEEFETML
ncbi:MAG: NAD-dependent DNA ligase LigA [Chlorobium sp.]|uniref:NAD-dependent DNA ligase LigA n=1 Tax=Chlorobium sp. TaxID=1095 RepID=UPI0025C3FF25|nr:NAD-dependent DNA ligase LigA [Chlorobium sp.]MCF8217243.1 NAD-dependent DNA ligase LigA [Chlorobium sp.]MCF8272101.1 NAD-dependent DNA ligase LigA [Chlorobium sp.]MCF8288462.1 NAD-dependent DNA ligase LigA [Chlorobium sp.]MCF8292052.1 NAD-dependent DNA ligase LigA [Chlorobium sp.]MCF8386154.1 NAD-dependent DNA ligase LigA [Chlorobium sp.]